MRLYQSFPASRKLQPLSNVLRQHINNVLLQILQGGINGAADLPGTKGSNRFVNGHDSAHFGGIDFLAVQDFDRRIHHLSASRALLVNFHLAVKDQLLARLQAAFQVAPVKKLAGKRARVVLDKQMVDGVAAIHPAYGLATHHLGSQGINPIGLNILNLGEMDGVFVTERQVIQQVFQGINPALRQKFCTARAHALHHLHIRLQANAHAPFLYIIPRVTSAFRETCACGLRIDRVGVWQIQTEAPLAEDRLSSSDKRILALWIICGILGALFAHKYFFRAFPEASVDFKVSRPEAQTRAKQFVEGLGENLTGYESTIVFSVDEQAKTYLERGLGLQEANHLMASQLNIWYWDVRFFRPQQEEEFLVRISPAGKVVGFEHKIEEARKLPSFSNDQAVAAAEAFAQSKLGMNLSQWEFLAPKQIQNPAKSFGLVFHLGTQRLQTEGCALSFAGRFGRRPRRRQPGISTSARSMEQGLRPPPLHESFLQSDCNYSLRLLVGWCLVAGDSPCAPG